MAKNSKSTSLAIRACRTAFLTTATYRDTRWKLEQLHGLHQLLLNSRDELITALGKGECDREYALLLQDIARHYLNILNPKASPPRQSLSGAAVIQSLPVGVSLILTNSANPLRYALAPLASCIAAGNAVILATESKCSQFFAVLSEKACQYLDSQAVHILPAIDLQDAIFSQVDQLLILDDHPRRYSTILLSPFSTFHSTAPACNLAVVDNGRTIDSKLTEDIHSSFQLPHTFSPERLTAVFIRNGELQTFKKSFSVAFGTRHPSPVLESENMPELGLSPFIGNTYQAELSKLLPKKGQSRSAFSTAIEAAQRTHVLLVVTYDSFEQIMDGISSMETPPLQLALLAPASQSSVEYFERWTRPQVFSVGAIRSVITPVISPYPSTSPLELETLFPSALFGRSHMRVSGQQPQVPLIPSVLRQNEKVVKPPAPAPVKTMDFFGYMRRVLKGVGVVFAGLASVGIWAGYKMMVSQRG